MDGLTEQQEKLVRAEIWRQVSSANRALMELVVNGMLSCIEVFRRDQPLSLDSVVSVYGLQLIVVRCAKHESESPLAIDENDWEQTVVTAMEHWHDRCELCNNTGVTGSEADGQEPCNCNVGWFRKAWAYAASVNCDSGEMG